MMKLLRLPLAVAVLALASCWLGEGVHALKPVPSKTAVKTIPPPPARKADVSHKLNTFDMMIAGGFATAMGDLAMHPIDTIKTVQQAAPAGLSIVKACGKILKDMGPIGFYAGVVPYVTMDGLSGAIKFATYEWGKKLVAPILPPALHAYSHFVCAAGAFISCSVVMVPGELLKQRLQAGVVPSMVGGIKQIWKTEGLPGFFTGYKATLIRDVPYTMLELGLYENFKTLLKKYRKREELTTLEELSAAAVTGGLVGLLTNPLDLVKTRLMTGTQYTGFFDVVQKMYKMEGGVNAFMSGSSARVLWLLPFTVIHLGVYEMSKRILADLKPTDAFK
ncbi:s-adenosylmethionine carrier 1 [Nannochloropsis oceanica]